TSRNPNFKAFGARLLTNRRAQFLFEFDDKFFLSGVDFGISKTPFRIPVGESVGETLLTLRYVFAAEDVEQFRGFETGRFGLAYDLKDGLVRSGFGDKHRHVAPNGWLSRKRFEPTRRITTGKQHVEVEFSEKDGIAQIVLPGE